MTRDARRIHILLAQDQVSFVLDEDIAQATRINLEEATALVNARLRWRPESEGELTRDERDEIARKVIQSELEGRYHAEKLRRDARLQ